MPATARCPEPRPGSTTYSLTGRSSRHTLQPSPCHPRTGSGSSAYLGTRLRVNGNTAIPCLGPRSLLWGPNPLYGVPSPCVGPGPLYGALTAYMGPIPLSGTLTLCIGPIPLSGTLTLCMGPVPLSGTLSPHPGP